MHFEILVEDASGKIALEHIIDKILGPYGTPHTYRIISYRGIGRLPKNLRGKTDPRKRILLDRLPRILRGYGRSLTEDCFVILLVDIGWPGTGQQKCGWAERISPLMDIENNKSRSFQVFRDGFRVLINR